MLIGKLTVGARVQHQALDNSGHKYSVQQRANCGELQATAAAAAAEVIIKRDADLFHKSCTRQSAVDSNSNQPID
jgi:hypothetical protein